MLWRLFTSNYMWSFFLGYRYRYFFFFIIFSNRFQGSGEFKRQLHIHHFLLFKYTLCFRCKVLFLNSIFLSILLRSYKSMFGDVSKVPCWLCTMGRCWFNILWYMSKRYKIQFWRKIFGLHNLYTVRIKSLNTHTHTRKNIPTNKQNKI